MGERIVWEVTNNLMDDGLCNWALLKTNKYIQGRENR